MLPLDHLAMKILNFDLDLATEGLEVLVLRLFVDQMENPKSIRNILRIGSREQVEVHGHWRERDTGIWMVLTSCTMMFAHAALWTKLCSEVSVVVSRLGYDNPVLKLSSC